jgi:hypothetical protein
MQDDGKLSRHRHFGLAQPAPLGQPHASGLEREPFRIARQQDIGGPVEIASQHGITAFRDAARPVNLAGCATPGCQSGIGAHTA